MSVVVAPELETERLVLRPHRPDDLDDCAAMWGDPEVVRHIGGKTFSREEVWARILRYAGLWPLLGYGYWAILERATGRYVGDAGLADFGRDLQPRLAVPESGWALASWAHGRGFATEAVRGVLGWYDAREDAADRTVCIIDRAHRASVRVAEKCGYGPARRVEYHGASLDVFERPTPS